MDASEETHVTSHMSLLISVVRDTLVVVLLPVHGTESYKELIQLGNIAKLNCVIANINLLEPELFF